MRPFLLSPLLTSSLLSAAEFPAPAVDQPRPLIRHTPRQPSSPADVFGEWKPCSSA